MWILWVILMLLGLLSLVIMIARDSKKGMKRMNAQNKKNQEKEFQVGGEQTLPKRELERSLSNRNPKKIREKKELDEWEKTFLQEWKRDSHGDLISGDL